MKCENVELTVLCLLYNKTHLLLQNRKKKDWKGYTLPGGHVEENESFVDAVIREMKEETGFDIVNPILCGVKQFPIDHGRYVVLLFKCNEYSGELQSSDEGEMMWINRNDLDKYPLVSDFKELLEVMENDHLSEFQYVVEGDDWIVHMK